MTRTRAARWTLGAAVVLVAQLAVPLVAEPAWAVPGLTVVQTMGPSDSNNKGLSMPCPPNLVVVGGGAKVTGAGQDYVHLGTLQPNEATNSFGVLAWEIEPGTNLNWQITVYAICITRPEHLYYVHADTVAQRSSASTQTIEAQCPTNTYVIGTGAYVTGGGQVLLQALIPDLSATVVARATVDFNGYGSTWAIGVWAVCTNAPNVQHYNFSANDSESPKTATVTCKSHLRPYAHSAGFETTGAPGRVMLTDLIPSLDHKVVVAAFAEVPAGTAANWVGEAHTTCSP